MRTLASTLMGSAVVFAAAGGRGSANLKSVDLTIPELLADGTPNPDYVAPIETDETDEDAPVVTFTVYDDLPDDLPKIRAKGVRMNFGFGEWPVGAHTLVTADLADRAKSAIQNARITNGKPNGKAFITRKAKGLVVKIGGKETVAYPDAKKGDIEVLRRA